MEINMAVGMFVKENETGEFEYEIDKEKLCRKIKYGNT